MKTFCTIITASYLPFATVLLQSLRKQDPEIELQILIVDKDAYSFSDGIIYHKLDAVTNSLVGKNIIKKYAHINSDYVRWALKPLFISYLLQNGFEKVIYCDPDIYFVSDFNFLFQKLDRSYILLTPHWSNIDPSVNEQGLYHVLRDGLFNAGFVAASKNGLDAINWWAYACHFKMEKNSELGLYDDQKYLDILPVYFNNVEILKHKGCNLAEWNFDVCKRENIDGKLKIDEQFEPVFIHFTKDTIAGILSQKDRLLISYLEEYSGLLKEANLNLHEKFSDLDFSKMNSKFIEWKYRLRPRTRLKLFLYNLIEKI